MLRLRGAVKFVRLSCLATRGCLSSFVLPRVGIRSSSSLQWRTITTSCFLRHTEKEIEYSLDGCTNEITSQDYHAESSDIQKHNQEMPQVFETTGIPAPLGIQVFPEIFDQLPPKCPGCGSIFQSKAPDEPGYIRHDKASQQQQRQQQQQHVSENTDKSLQGDDKPLICQRCFNFKNYNKAVPVKVNNSHIMKLLSHITRRKALIVYVVDIMDLPGSIFPHLLDVVGQAKRIVIAANKVDMLSLDGRPWVQEERLRSQVMRLCTEHGLQGANVKDVCLVSAKHGFGISQLVSKIHEHWDPAGDVYMMGCSNTGKTTLFNTLADLLNVHKKQGDMLHRATVSHWPGTTLSLMRFPLGNWMLSKLQWRLNKGVTKDEKSDDEVTMDTEIIDRQETSYKDNPQTESIQDVALSDENQYKDVDVYKPEFVNMETEKNQTWFYDTPGILSENQITSYLTMQELKLLHPSRWIIPRTLILKPGQTLLLGGLGRMDFIEISRKPLEDSDAADSSDTLTEANRSIFFTVFASTNLPLHVLNTTKADDFLQRHAGSDMLKVPSGDEKRMALFPTLQSRDLTLTGIGWDESAADVVLSNVGWAAVTAGKGSDLLLRAYTPNGRGVGIRVPALLPTSVTQRGKRGVPYLGHLDRSAYQAHRSQSPQLIKSLGHGQRGAYSWMRESKRAKKQQLASIKEKKLLRVMEKSLAYTAVTRLPQSHGAIGLQITREKQEEKGEEKLVSLVHEGETRH